MPRLRNAFPMLAVVASALTLAAQTPHKRPPPTPPHARAELIQQFQLVAQLQQRGAEAKLTHLEQILIANRHLIHGDVWLVCDGPVDQTRRQTLIFGARGDAHFQITVYGPSRSLHSGQHAANENLRLQNLWDGIETMAALIAMPQASVGSNIQPTNGRPYAARLA